MKLGALKGFTVLETHKNEITNVKLISTSFETRIDLGLPIPALVDLILILQPRDNPAVSIPYKLWFYFPAPHLAVQYNDP